MKKIKKEIKIYLKVYLRTLQNEFELQHSIELKPEDCFARETVAVLLKDPVEILKENVERGAFVFLNQHKKDVVFQTVLERTYKKQWLENSSWGVVY